MECVALLAVGIALVEGYRPLAFRLLFPLLVIGIVLELPSVIKSKMKFSAQAASDSQK
jgi:hypothetical protein